MTQPIVLNEENVSDYIINDIDILKKGGEITEVTEIKKYTNSGYVFKISLENYPHKTIFLKQSRDRTKNDFELPAERVCWEAESIIKFNEILEEKIAPEVIFLDKDNNVLIMEDISVGGEFFIDLFKQERLKASDAKMCAEMFGKLHGRTYGMKEHNFGENDEWYIFLTDFVFREYDLIGFKKFFNEKDVDKILDESVNATQSFCHVDPYLKNIYFHKDKMRIVDFEQATKWDPAYDIGSFLTPWAIVLLSDNSKLKEECRKFITDFIEIYQSILIENGVSKDDLPEIIYRALRYTATTILHHTWGSGNSDFMMSYKDKVKIEIINLLENRKSSFTQEIRKLYGVEKNLL